MNYVDIQVANLAVIFTARLATTVNLVYTYANGASGVGATLTAAGAGTVTIDGTSVLINDLILFKNQATTFQNGYYKCTNDGSVTAAVFTRSTEYDQPSEINPGDLFVITSGSTQAQTTWIETSSVTTIGTDPITFNEFSVALPITVPSGGTGLTSLTAHDLIIGNGASNVNLLAPSATSGVPLISQGSSADPAYGTAVVAGGGTGNTTFTAYSVICAGTTATGVFQNVSGVGSATQVLTSNGPSTLPSWQALPASGFTTVNIQVITSNATYTPTASMKYCIVEIVGGGGSGGGVSGGTASQGAAATGGGGGGYCRKTYSAAQLGATAAVVVGTGGTGATAGANDGNAGGNSTFTPAGAGAILTATGGSKGFGVGKSPTSGTTGNGSSQGGTGTNGDINIPGGPGGNAAVQAAGVLALSGQGGGSYFAPSQPGFVVAAVTGFAGLAGLAYGGGSNGAADIATADRASSAGANGVCYVTEFI
jgi:hypothetical protein